MPARDGFGKVHQLDQRLRARYKAGRDSVILPAFEFCNCMKRKAESAFDARQIDRADEGAPETSDAAGGQTAPTKLLAACQRFAEPPVPIPRAPFALSAGLGSANVRAIKKGDLDLVRT